MPTKEVPQKNTIESEFASAIKSGIFFSLKRADFLTGNVLKDAIDKLVDEMKILSEKLFKNFKAETDVNKLDKLFSSYFNDLITQITQSLQAKIVILPIDVSLKDLTAIQKIFLGHQKSLVDLQNKIHSKLPTLEVSFDNIGLFLNELKDLKVSIANATPIVDLSALEREAVELRFTTSLKQAGIALKEIEVIAAKKIFNPTKPIAVSSKTYPNVYQALQDEVLSLQQSLDYNLITEVSNSSLRTSYDKKTGENQRVYAEASTNLGKLVDAALGKDRKSGLIKIIFENEIDVKNLLKAKKELAAVSSTPGTAAYIKKSADLNSAYIEFDNWAKTYDTISLNLLTLLKEDLNKDLTTIITEINNAEWTANLEVTYPALKTLKDAYAPYLVDPKKLEAVSSSTKVKEILDNISALCNTAKIAVNYDHLEPDKKQPLDANYFDNFNNFKNLILSEITRRERVDTDYMNMDPLKLADLVNAFGGKGLKLEGGVSGAGQEELGLFKAWHDRLFQAKIENLQDKFGKLTKEGARILEAKMLCAVARFDNINNASDTIPEGNRSNLKEGCMEPLGLARNEFFAGVSNSPVFGKVFSELLQRVVWAIGLKEGWQVNSSGALEKVTKGRKTKARQKYSKEFDYNEITSSVGKSRLIKLIELTFQEIIKELVASKAPPKEIKAITDRADYIKTICKAAYQGFGMLDESHVLRQRIESQTKAHDSSKSPNYNIANYPFADLMHKIWRYDKGLEVATAIYMLFYRQLTEGDLLDAASENKNVEKITMWRKMLVDYFNICGISLKGVLPELTETRRFANSHEIATSKAPLDNKNSTVVKPMEVPKWGESTFPTFLEVITKPEYDNNITWSMYFKALEGWMLFMDTIKSSPSKVSMAMLFDNGDESLIQKILESSTLGMAKLIKGRHFDAIPQMLTFYIQKLIANLEPNSTHTRMEALTRIVQKLENTCNSSKKGLAVLYPQIQMVIANLKGDGQFQRRQERYSKKEEMDGGFKILNIYDIQKKILAHGKNIENFRNGHFKYTEAGTSDDDFWIDLRTGLIAIKPTVSISADPARLKALEHLLHEMNKVFKPYGNLLKPSEEKTDGDSHKK